MTRAERIWTCLTYEFAEARGVTRARDVNRAAAFTAAQFGRMPDYLRFPFVVITWLFAATCPGYFRATPERRARHLESWRRGRLGAQRDFVRAVESLATLHLASFPNEKIAPPRRRSRREGPPSRAQVVVIGSGPGGAVTAATLAEAGRDVVVLEEGTAYQRDEVAPFSAGEMEHAYRSGGLTVAMGRSKIAFVEGRCIGGGSEVNSGLYHRTPEAVLASWRETFGLADATLADLRPDFEFCERALDVQTMPMQAPLSSRLLDAGAARVGWRAAEIPRWYSYPPDETGRPRPQKNSMSTTFVPRAEHHGARLRSGHRVDRVEHRSGGVRVIGRAGDRPFEIDADDVFVCAGATETPALLLRSGVGENVGRRMQLHPTAKILGTFDDVISDEGAGVAVHQVKHPNGRISFGCSIASRGHQALSLVGSPDLARIDELWRNSAIYYAMIKPEGVGRLRVVPGHRAPLLTYGLTAKDYLTLNEGLNGLARMLFEAGARTLRPSVGGAPVLERDRPATLGCAPGDLNLMTIHLFSGAPAGENRRLCVTNSFGRVHDARHVYVNDASLLCSAPGVNPQGSIMAFARRNARHYLETR